MNESRAYWDDAARHDAAWHVATGHGRESAEFFRQGATETDSFLQFCGITPDERLTALEIGCGVGRMTRRLAELFGQVIGVDISGEMIARCAENLASFDNVTLQVVPGDGRLPDVPCSSVDVVFSYITLQHVPSKQAQRCYISEAARVLRVGGHLGIQVRSTEISSRLLDLCGQVVHVLRRRRTLNPSWRGARLDRRELTIRMQDHGIQGTIQSWPHRHMWNAAHWWIVGTKVPEGTQPAIS